MKILIVGVGAVHAGGFFDAKLLSKERVASDIVHVALTPCGKDL